MNFSELHDCEKSHSKIVLIECDSFGNTFCGYCHERVDYSRFFIRKEIEKRLNNIIEYKIR